MFKKILKGNCIRFIPCKPVEKFIYFTYMNTFLCPSTIITKYYNNLHIGVWKLNYDCNEESTPKLYKTILQRDSHETKALIRKTKIKNHNFSYLIRKHKFVFKVAVLQGKMS